MGCCRYYLRVTASLRKRLRAIEQEVEECDVMENSFETTTTGSEDEFELDNEDVRLCAHGNGHKKPCPEG